MTDQEKNETKVCKCGELGRFFTQVASIFLGVLLAILVSAAILKPQMPCHKGIPPMNGPHFERQISPSDVQWNGGPQKPNFKKMHREFHKDNFIPDESDAKQPLQR